MTIRETILDQMRNIAQQQHKTLAPLSDEVPLLESGLEFAVPGHPGRQPGRRAEPRSVRCRGGAEIPVTVGEFVRLYEAAAIQA